MSDGQIGGIGRSDFVARHALWNDEQLQSAGELVRRARAANIRTVRVSFADQHGVLRGKTLVVDMLESVLNNGCSITSTLLLKDTAHRTVYPVWQSGTGLNLAQLTGAADMVLVPDPTTFHLLPWVPGSAWMLADCYYQNGLPVPFCTRGLCRTMLRRLEQAGYRYLAGLELDLPMRSLESEMGPSQVELTFSPADGLWGADNVVLIRSAIKQICRRHGYHATFMCRPALANMASSGWHLHQSLLDAHTGENAFVSGDERELLSPCGRQYVAGLLEHARAACLFAAPTINGYKRYRPYSLAPNKIVWARDNRGAMIRVIGGPGDPGTHLENRIGESAANPYLYFASQIVSGLDGIARKAEPPPAVDTPYDCKSRMLPASLVEAITELRQSALFRTEFGDAFVDYLLTVKEFEVHRFLSDEVTDWEQREYFELF